MDTRRPVETRQEHLGERQQWLEGRRAAEVAAETKSHRHTRKFLRYQAQRVREQIQSGREGQKVIDQSFSSLHALGTHVKIEVPGPTLRGSDFAGLGVDAGT